MNRKWQICRDWALAGVTWEHLELLLLATGDWVFRIPRQHKLLACLFTRCPEAPQRILRSQPNSKNKRDRPHLRLPARPWTSAISYNLGDFQGWTVGFRECKVYCNLVKKHYPRNDPRWRFGRSILPFHFSVKFRLQNSDQKKKY